MRTISVVVALAILATPALAQEEERITKLVQDLGAEDFKTREAAEAELKKIGAPAVPQLKKALEDKDAERADRARKILAEIDKPKSEPKRAPRRGGIKSVYRDLTRGLTVIVEDGRLEVTVPEEDKETGKKVYKTYKADSIEQFQEKHPEVAKKYDIEKMMPRFEVRPIDQDEFEKFWQDWKKRFEDDWRRPFDEDWFKEWKPSEDFDKWFEEQRKLLDELRKRRSGDVPPEGERKTPSGGEFGIKIEPVNETLAAQLELKEGEGVQVAEVKPASLAEKAGMKKHDVIVKLNGKAVADKWEFRRAIREGLDKGFELELFRAGKRETVKVKPVE